MRRLRIKKALCVCIGMIVAFASVFAFDLTALAEKTYSFYLDESKDIEIVIRYEGSAPSVKVTGPDAEYVSDSDYAKVENGSTTRYLYIRDAAAGRWEITSDKEITHTVLGWYTAPEIKSFVMDASDKDRISLKSEVSAEKKESFDWYIYALKLDQNGNPTEQMLLSKTGGSTNSENTTSVGTRNLPDGTYRLAMEAVVTHSDGTELTDNAEIVETFTVTGHTAAGDPAAVSAVYDMTDKTLDIDWRNVKEGYDDMFISVTQGSETIFYDSLKNGVTSAQIIADNDAGDTLEAELRPMDDGTYNTKYTMSVPTDPGIGINIDTPEATGELMAGISYDTAGKTVLVNVAVNGKNDDYRLSGSGSLSVPLEAMENNDITIRFSVSDGIYYVLHKTVSVNSAPPMLEFYGVSDGMLVDSDKLTVTGRTDPDAELTVNGIRTNVGDNGSFTAEIPLSKGENQILFVSKNSYGIMTSRTLTVNRPGGGPLSGGGVKGILPLLIAIAAALVTGVVILLVGLLSRKRQRSVKQMLYRLLIVVLSISDISFILAAVYCGMQIGAVTKTISGSALTGVLEESSVYGVSEALALRDIWKGRMWGMIITAIVITCVVIALLILAGIRKNKNARKRA